MLLRDQMAFGVQTGITLLCRRLERKHVGNCLTAETKCEYVTGVSQCYLGSACTAPVVMEAPANPLLVVSS